MGSARSGRRERGSGGLAASLARNSAGASSIEYALIAMLIALVIIAALVSIGTTLSGWFGTVASSL